MNKDIAEIITLNNQINLLNIEISKSKFLFTTGKRYKLLQNKLLDNKERFEKMTVIKNVDEDFNNMATTILVRIQAELSIESTYVTMVEANLTNCQKLLDNIKQDVQNRITLLIAIVSLVIAVASLIVSAIGIWQ